MPARNDPFKNFSFRVEIDGLASAGFCECEGLGAEIEVIDYREGSDPTHVRKLPGLRKFSQVTLKRGITDNLELWNWYRDVASGNAARRNGAIILLDDAGNPVARWHFVNAFPCKYEGPRLNAKANDVAIEVLILQHEGIERV